MAGALWERNFLKWFGEHGATATYQTVIDYRDDLNRQGLRSSTIAVRLAALTSFYGEAKKRGLVERDSAEGVDRPTVAAYAAAR